MKSIKLVKNFNLQKKNFEQEILYFLLQDTPAEINLRICSSVDGLKILNKKLAESIDMVGWVFMDNFTK